MTHDGLLYNYYYDERTLRSEAYTAHVAVWGVQVTNFFNFIYLLFRCAVCVTLEKKFKKKNIQTFINKKRLTFFYLKRTY